MKKMAVKSFVLIFILILVIGFVSANIFDDFFNWFKGKSKPLSSPQQIEFKGLPDGFKTISGFYHSFDNGRVILCNQYGECYISKDGLNFQEFTNEEMVAVGLPQNFEPKVGFYHPFGGDGGRIILSNSISNQVCWSVELD